MELKTLPTKKRLRELFDYRDGKLFRRVAVSGSGVKKGERAGGNGGHGYRRLAVDNEDYFEHRLIWCWHYGRTKKFIDHKNSKKSDNRIKNLREATKTHNEWHKPKRRHNTTGFKNVYLLNTPCPRKFWAYITVNGKRKGLGCYHTARAAFHAYLKASRVLHKEFSYHG